ncbi:MAG: CopG family transcriptional regulator [Crenarchaeota archaeon]|nr:CopG family transcriptional regulator [Thermoproteota archaeon]
MSEKVTIQISKELYEKARQYIEKIGGFNSVEEFIEFVLNEVLSEETSETTLSKEEEELVKQRLRSLGYL